MSAFDAATRASRAALGNLRRRRRAFAERRLGRRLAGPRLLRDFAAAYPEAFFIEIGASDGVLEDPLAPFIRSRRWSGIMVEPVPHVFERLRRNYGDLDRVALENVAIADHDGRLPFHRIAPAENTGPGGDGEDYSAALGSFHREIVVTTASRIPGARRRVERIEVPCLSFESLLRKHDVEQLDLLAIDTEGHDYEIIKQNDFGALVPRVLVYEQLFLSARERQECSTMLEEAGYELMQEGFDTWCVDARVDDPLTSRWRELQAAGPVLTEQSLLRWIEGTAGRRG